MGCNKGIGSIMEENTGVYTLTRTKRFHLVLRKKKKKRRIAKKMSTCGSNTCFIHHCPFLATGYQITGEMVQVSAGPWERTGAVHQLPRVNCLYFNSFWLASEILVSQMNWSAGGWPVLLQLAEKGLGGITRIQRSLWIIEKGNTGWNLLHPSWQGSEPAKCWLCNCCQNLTFSKEGCFQLQLLQALLRAHSKEERCCLCRKRNIGRGEGVSSCGVDLWSCPLSLISLSCISELCTPQLVQPCFGWHSWAEQMGTAGDVETTPRTVTDGRVQPPTHGCFWS